MYLCPSFIIVQVEEELAKEKDNTAKLENTVRDLTSQCTISLQQTEEFRKEVKEKVSVMNCLIVKWQTDWFHGKLSGHVRCPLVNTRQQQKPYSLSKDVVRACLLPRPQWFCRWRQPQKIALWLVFSVMPVPCQLRFTFWSILPFFDGIGAYSAVCNRNFANDIGGDNISKETMLLEYE